MYTYGNVYTHVYINMCTHVLCAPTSDTIFSAPDRYVHIYHVHTYAHIYTCTYMYVTWSLDDSFIFVTWWLIHMCDMTHPYVWHDAFICVTWIIHMCDTTCLYMEWLIHMCDMTHSYVQHDSFICATRLIRTCDMTHWYVWHDSLIRASWLVHACCQGRECKLSLRRVLLRVMPHSYMRDDSFVRVPWLIHMCDMTHSYVRHASFICATCLMTRSCVTWLLLWGGYGQ